LTVYLKLRLGARYRNDGTKLFKNANNTMKKPFCKVEEKVPLIPTTANVELIINNDSQKYATEGRAAVF